MKEFKILVHGPLNPTDLAPVDLPFDVTAILALDFCSILRERIPVYTLSSDIVLPLG